MPVRILVPFDDLARLQETLCQAMKLAERLAAELVLLRVNLPERRSSGFQSESSLYSELKALQAQCASCPNVVRIETMAGRAEQAIMQFAALEGIDLIVTAGIGALLPAEPAKSTGGKRRDAGAPVWARQRSGGRLEAGAAATAP